MKNVVKRITLLFPQLKSKLIQAGMTESPEEFVKKTLRGSINMGLLVVFSLVLLATKIEGLWVFTIAAIPLVFVGIFMFLIRLPDVKVMKREKEINKEIVFVGRFLVIELESGVPLYRALANIIPSYPNTAPYFREIITKVDMGTPMEEALNDTIRFSPSKNMQKLLWQIVNSLQTGADIHKALDSVVEQIVREQIIEVERYGKKLNPLAMFYMMVAVIMPTLGTAMLTVLTNFIAIDITLGGLLIFASFIGFIQLMFLNIIKSQRPAVDL